MAMPLENLVPHLVVAAVQIIEEEEEDHEAMQLQIARIAAAEIMELEEGEGLVDLVGEAWVAVTVIIDEYHRMGDPCFQIHFRMSRGVFEVLCETVHAHLITQGRLRREKTPFQDIMLMTVWLLATPDTFRSVALRFGVRPSTLHYFYTYVVEALRELAHHYITWPNEEERNTIKEAFLRATGFPGVVGCCDGTHIFITAPPQDAASYRNRHHCYSLNVQAVVDNNLLVRHIHVGEVGSMSDKRVFRRSRLKDELLQGRGISPDEHLLGDGGYVLTSFMMIPFENNGHLTGEQQIFNRRLSQGRVRVENSFGRAKGKWRRLKMLPARNQAYVVDHITASFVLHNFVLLHGEQMLDEDELARPIRVNQILGNERIDDPELEMEEAQDNEAAWEAARLMGHEKRLWIMQGLLPNPEDEI